MTDPLSGRKVPASYLRRLFNDRRLAEAARSGEITTELRRTRHPAVPSAGEPICTRSQLVTYYDSNVTRIAIVHQYLRRDGSLGASGRPDPKWLLHEGEALTPE